MKHLIAFFALFLCTFTLSAATASSKNLPASAAAHTSLSAPSPMEQFMSMTPKKYEEMTGKKMNWVQKLKFKGAQKLMKIKEKKANAPEISQPIYIVMSIFFLGWLAIGILDDWEGYDWLIALVLYCLFWLPGVIFSLIKMMKYFN